MDLAKAGHAFITGGASGIGLGIADALASRGISVTIADINEEALKAVVARRGNQLRGIHLDTRDRNRWLEAKDEAEAAFGPVDILVNNAGISPNGRKFDQMDPESFERILGINLIGIYNGVWAFVGDMITRGSGHIVNTSSLAGMMATVPGITDYSIAKFGVTALTEHLRMELDPQGIGVSLLIPSYVETNLSANTVRIGGETRDQSIGLPGEAVKPGEVGEMVAVAIEQNAPYIITHPNVWPGIEKRFAEIRAACEFRNEAVAS